MVHVPPPRHTVNTHISHVRAADNHTATVSERVGAHLVPEDGVLLIAADGQGVALEPQVH